MGCSTLGELEKALKRLFGELLRGSWVDPSELLPLSTAILYRLTRSRLFSALFCKNKSHPLTQHGTCAKYRTL